MTNKSLVTYATLKDDTPFNQIFPDGQVPIITILPITPTAGAPQCYYVDSQYLTNEQLTGLAQMTYERWKPECTSIEMATQYVQKGLPISREWFSGVTTTDFAEYMKLVD